jgi:hypothetical protein
MFLSLTGTLLFQTSTRHSKLTHFAVGKRNVPFIDSNIPVGDRKFAIGDSKFELPNRKKYHP